jgi:glycosyltransferase involved in cell wall biosynthesis
MRIVCISASQIPSSTANSIQVMKACQALAQLGHDICLLVPKVENRDSRIENRDANLDSRLSKLYGLHTPFSIEWLPANPRLCRYDFCWTAVQRALVLKADAVYVWPLQAAVFAALRRVPVLLELHGEPEGTLGPTLFRLFLRLPGKKRLLPITQSLFDLLHTRGTISTSRGAFSVVISPNGVDLERYQNLPIPEAARRELGLPEMPTVGYTGHLYPGRGMNLLIELAHRYPQAHFLWVGGRPDDVENWRRQLSEQDISNVTLTGFIDNNRLPLYQAAAEVLLMPYERVITGSSGGNSAAYCSPMKMFEYMACGRAIISSDLPVIREVLNEDNTVLCPPEEAESWTQALGTLLADPEKRATLAHHALQDVQDYTWLERARRAMEGFSVQ